MKRNLNIFLLVLLLLSLTLFSVACQKKPTDVIIPEDNDIEKVVEPTLGDITADVTERPAGISIGTYTLNKVLLNEVEQTNDDYLVRNKHFILANEFYGSIGTGEHKIKLIFKEGEKTYNLNITDSLSPKYSYALSNKMMFGTDDSVNLPVVSRDSIFQEFDCKYVVYNSDNQELYNQLNVEKTSETLKLEGLNIGDYRLKVQIRKSGNLLKEFNCNFAIEKYYNNIFGLDNLSNWSLTNTTITKAYDASEEALTLTTGGRNGLNGRYYVAYISTDPLKTAIQKGCKTLTFKYKVNNTFAESTLFNISGNSDAAGIRIYGKKNVGLDTDGIVSTSAGIYVYKDITELSTEYKTVSINIEEFLAASADINYFAMVVSGDKNSTIYLKDARFNNDESRLYLENIFSQQNSLNWALSNFIVAERSFNETEQAFSFKLKDINDSFSGRNYVAYYDVNTLKSAYNNGYKKLIFSVKCNSLLENSIGEKGLRIFGKTKYNMDNVAINTNIENGIYKYLDLTNLNSTDYISVEIDLEEFLSTGINYFGMVLAGDGGSEIYIKNANFSE